MSERVTIGVPIYRGELYLEETLNSIQRQTYKSFDVIMSLDTPDPVCEAICAKFIGDPRFKLVVQPQRLGWVGNINWLISHVTNEYWYYHQQDDLTEGTYLEILLDHAQRHSSAALVYCDIRPIGRIEGPSFSSPSVLGATPYTRVMTLLHEHFPAFAFRGLTRSQALKGAGPIGVNDVDCLGVDITWLTGIARSGELHRVPLTLYNKRYHNLNTESRWWTLSREDQLRSWSRHCIDMLGQALQVRSSPEQARLLWSAAVARLTIPEAAGHYLKIDDLALQDRTNLLESFLSQAISTYGKSLTVWLDADWDAVVRWTKSSFWLPRSDPVTITGFGPSPVVCGRPFNVQPDGSFALWVLADRYLPPKTKICLDGTNLETTLSGTIATTKVPLEAVSQPGELKLCLVGPDGTAQSNSVVLKVLHNSSG
jgi:GT2 family glycosyltransferase